MTIKTSCTLLILLLSFTGLTANASDRELWRNGIDYLALSNEESLQDLQHPVTLDINKVAEILSNIRFSNKGTGLTSLINETEPESQRVFTDREIKELAPGIQKALQQASGSEVLKFSISDFRDIYFGKTRLSTSGQVFVQNQRLNILLGEVNVDLQKKYVRSGSGVSNSRFASKVELSHFKLSTGDLDKATAHGWQLGPFAGAERVNQRPDWLSINLQQEYKYVHNQQKKEQFLAVQQQNQATEKQDELEQRLTRLEMASRETKSVPDTDGSLELKLKKLKQLYDDGLLPKDVYFQKLNSVLADM